MKLIVCVDDNNAMAFNYRRQSSDRTVLLKIKELIQGNKLWIHPYSERLLSTTDINLCAEENFMEKAGLQDYGFAEITDVAPHFSRVNEIIIFHWNRKYPADLHFPMAFLSEGWKMTGSLTFSGNSHAEITQEIYIRC